MDKRTFLALLLSALVIVLTPILFRGLGFGRRQPPVRAAAGTNTAMAAAPVPTPPPQPAAATPPASATTGPAAIGATATSGARARNDTVGVAFGKTRFVFNSAGASPQEI